MNLMSTWLSSITSLPISQPTSLLNPILPLGNSPLVQVFGLSAVARSVSASPTVDGACLKPMCWPAPSSLMSNREPEAPGTLGGDCVPGSHEPMLIQSGRLLVSLTVSPLSPCCFLVGS